MKWSNLSIRRKVFWALLASNGLVLFFACAAFLGYDIASLRKSMVQGYLTRAQIIAVNSSAALAFQNPGDAADVLAALGADRRVLAACLYDAQGRVFAQYPASAPESGFPPPGGVSGYRQGALEIFCPVEQGGRRLGTVYLRSDLSLLTDRYKTYALLSLAVVAGALGLALLLARLLQGELVAPLLALARTARQVSEKGDFALRARRFGSDELGGLTDDFNQMLERIQAQDRALKDSEANYREIFEKAGDAIVVLDPDPAASQIVVDLNTKTSQMTGYSAEEFKRTPVEKLISGEPGSRLEDFIRWNQKAMTEGPQVFEWKPRHKDGHAFWVEVGLQKTTLAGKTRLVAFMRDIADRKKLEEITRLGEAQAIENVKDYAILMLDKEGKILTWNRGAEAIKGYARSEALGKFFGLFYLPEERASGIPEGNLREAAQKGQIEIEGVRVRKDGSHFEADVILTALKDEKGDLKGFIKVTRDVTEMRRAQREIKEKNELLDLVLKNIADGVVVADEKGRFLLFNPAAEKISGRPGEGAATGQWTEQFGIFRSDRRTPFPEAENPLAVAVRGGATDNVEMFLRNAGHPEGVVVSASSRPLKDGKGANRGGVAIFRDVTEQKAAEGRIREANEFLNATLENLPNMVFVKDAKDLRFVMFNRAGEELIGVPRAELIGKNDHDLFPKDEADFFTAKDRKTLEEGKMVDIPEETIQTRLKGKRVLHTRKIPVLGADGKPRYLLGISEDITEQKKQEELRVYTKALEASNKDLQDFIFVASHDLQEPLRKIQAFGNFLDQEEGQTLTPTGKDYLARIRDASMRMSVLLSDLLDLTRITTRAKPFERVELDQILAEVASDLEIRLKETGARLECEKLPAVDADPAQMRQLFQNLISNSLKFHKPGQVPEIRVRAQVEGGQVQLRLTDKGIGFDPKYAEKIFNIFQRLHGQGQYPGTGIGLAICRKVVERHGGKIRAESREGEGATFVISLPLRHHPPEEGEVESSGEKGGVHENV
ncbi:MAG TPA: PAS domain S-box protein [bacterium]|nr:PAS domain S-box protein [bacterium]